MDGYQIVSELSPWKQKHLSTADRERLKAAGVLKPEAEYIKGMDRGTDNIIKKKKSKFIIVVKVYPRN